MSIIFQAILCSIDSLIASFAISPLTTSKAKWWRLAGLFGVCDGLGLLAGVIFGGLGINIPIAPLFMFVFGIYCFLALFWNKVTVNEKFLAMVPVIMGLDSFICGITNTVPFGELIIRAILFGAFSFLFALFGFRLGQFMYSKDNPKKNTLVAGLSLVISSLLIYFT